MSRRLRFIPEGGALVEVTCRALPLGVAPVLAQDPLQRPKKIKKSPAPAFHAASKAVRRELWDAYALFVAAYRAAAEKLRAGLRDVVFPRGVLVNIAIMRAFVRLREILAANRELAAKAEEMERRYDSQFKIILPPCPPCPILVPHVAPPSVL
jgi:hypothetical protein